MDKKGKLQLFLWLEALVWILLISIVVGGLRYHNYKEHKQYKTYQIFLQDVDGLIVGSPVKMMGVQIGHIEKVKIVSDNIYVKFVLEDKNLSLPKGVIATVEFNGLGGSKSLELYPPNKASQASNKLIVIHTPMRIHDSMGLLNEMFDKLNSIMLRCARFNNEVGDLIPTTDDISIPEEQAKIKNFNERIESLNNQRFKVNDKIKKWTKHE